MNTPSIAILEPYPPSRPIIACVFGLQMRPATLLPASSHLPKLYESDYFCLLSDIGTHTEWN